MSNVRIASIDQLCAMFKALANPHRLRILLKLAECCGPTSCTSSDEGVALCVGDLGVDQDVAPSTVSHHIKELRQSGLMHVERHGQRIECWVNEDALRLLAGFFDDTITKRKHELAARAGSPSRVHQEAGDGRDQE